MVMLRRGDQFDRRLATATLHGPSRTGIVAITLNESASITDTSFDGSLAEKMRRPRRLMAARLPFPRKIITILKTEAAIPDLLDIVSVEVRYRTLSNGTACNRAARSTLRRPSHAANRVQIAGLKR